MQLDSAFVPMAIVVHIARFHLIGALTHGVWGVVHTGGATMAIASALQVIVGHIAKSVVLWTNVVLTVTVAIGTPVVG